MTWGNPLAWLGAVTVVIPVLVHFFTRKPGRVTPFPSLRFVPRSRLVPAWSRTPSDLLLMLLRMVVLLLATAALARPLLPVAASANASVSARIVIVDSSWSMLQREDGVSPIDSAILVARVLADSADVARIVFSERPADELVAAADWLNATNGRTRELILVSDFQQGTIDSLTVANVAARAGFRAVRVPRAVPMRQQLQARVAGSLLTSEFALDDASTVVRYRNEPLSSERKSIVAIGGGDTTSDARLLRNVVNASAFPYDTAHGARPVAGASEVASSTAVYFADSDSWADARTRAGPIRTPWQAEIVAALASDVDLAQVASIATAVPAAAGTADRFGVVASNSAGSVILDAAAREGEQSGELMIFAHVPTLSPAAASVVAAIERFGSAVAPAGERDTTLLTDAELERLSTAVVAQPDPLENIEAGRFVWAAVLLALLFEWLLRRAVQARTPSSADAAGE